MRLVSRSCTWLVNDYAISVQINGPPTGDGSDEWLSSTFVEYTSPHTGRSTKLLDNSFGSATFASVDRAREAAAKFLVENGFSDPLRFDSVHFRTERWVDETAVGARALRVPAPWPKVAMVCVRSWGQTSWDSDRLGGCRRGEPEGGTHRGRDEREDPLNAEKRKPWVRKGAVCAEKRKPWVRKDPLNAEKRKPWIRKGAVCECHGEGKGNLFVIEALKGNCAWLVSLRPIYGAKARYPLGWKELKGCYRSDKARRAERALDP